jgi:hypothetical protein
MRYRESIVKTGGLVKPFCGGHLVFVRPAGGLAWRAAAGRAHEGQPECGLVLAA